MGVRFVDYITNNMDTIVPIGVMGGVLVLMWFVAVVFRSETRQKHHWLARGAATRALGCVMSIAVLVVAMGLLVGAFVVTRAFYLTGR